MEEPRHPVSGIDYPGTFQDFDNWFSSGNAALNILRNFDGLKALFAPVVQKRLGQAVLAIGCRPVPRKMITGDQIQHMVDG